MKLDAHVNHIRQLIDNAFRNRLGRMGFVNFELQLDNSGLATDDHKRINTILDTFKKETGNSIDAFEKLVEEFTFTLFNRLAALKVMEAHVLHPEIITRRSEHGDRSFAHLAWLEQNPNARDEENEGLVSFLEDQLQTLANDIPLFSPHHPYHLLPTAIELNNIILAINQVEVDEQVETNIWKSDDVLGWLYESYNNFKKTAHKESKAKTEYNKVSIQSQVYTPRWVVKFLVDNSLGKLYLEMYPDSEIKSKYKIANAPTTQTRKPKKLTEIRLIDPATGSGNFLLYGFDLFYDLYTDQIENYGASYNQNKIAESIIKHNLHGIDLDDRAVQLAQLGLYIKAKRKKRSTKIDHFNVVSSDFFLPDYEQVQSIFEENNNFDSKQKEIIRNIWSDLQNAYKFGSLIQLEEKLSRQLHDITKLFDRQQLSMYADETLANYENFRENFFINLQKAVELNAAKQGLTFLNTKTQDAITFLQLLTQKYDVAVANPPYTDSADFGTELKEFIEANYKQTFKFNTNLYATFIKRCCELCDEKGKIGMVHPPTFMYIKTFEDVRKYIIEKMHINLFVEWGYLGMFNPTARVDSAMYILEKESKNIVTQFIKFNDLYEGKRYEAFTLAYSDLISNSPNKYNITLPQSKLKIIEGYPFIYWISDGFREKFKGGKLKEFANANKGIDTANNNKYLRFFWEIDNSYDWANYSKGGPYNKWYGNLWLKILWKNNGEAIKNDKSSNLRNKESFFKEGITYSGSGSKGASFRHLPKNFICDNGGSSITPLDGYENVMYLLAFANSKLIFYIIDCLNPTVNIQKGDLERIPFIVPSKQLELTITELASKNVGIKKKHCSYSIIESNFNKNPILEFSENTLRTSLLAYLNYENIGLTEVMLNESIINKLIFDVYNLSKEDRHQVILKMGESLGELPVLGIAREQFLVSSKIENEIVFNHIKNLPLADYDDQRIREINESFETLYQSNNDLEEFCIRHQLNPINVWYWFKESKVLPQARAAEITLEFLADAFRSILMEDEDGIIPLVGLPNEPRLLDKLEEHCLKQGFTSAQFMQLDSLLGRPLNDYIEHHFFKNLSDLLNLFMYLPKTPFIWHLSSGEQQGFEAYIIIYKWSRDNLYNLKTNYLNKRVQSLEYRQIQIVDSTTAQAQSEKETIRLQLQEIAEFTKKVEELIAEGYDPKLDDGVGKNIAPLQKKGMLRDPVLKETQLEKYLNADW